MQTLRRKDILGLEEMSAEEITLILETARSMREIMQRKIKKVPTLRGRSILNLFYEPSTRTKASFELAQKYMSADSVSVAGASSSLTKGETLKDTVRNVEVMGVECVIMRHPVSGSAYYLAHNVEASVINAGDGMHEHPTQGLLDMFTIWEKKGRLEKLKVTIVGDIRHSRVARSNIWGLKKMGAEVVVAGPPTLMPPDLEVFGINFCSNVEDAVEDADVVMALRLQKERQESGLFPSLREYAELYGLNTQRLKKAKEDALIMHPGPMNRGIEITSELADGPNSVVLEQVTGGVAVRMALLYLLLGGTKEE
ncbi:MAG: aspartate carbamoyltransferase catalytic subunit [Bacillota bacterium]|nr:aspartate carbamoyltransferase catalytic subunit [Bacillota bacterium]